MGFQRRKFEVFPSDPTASKRAKKIIATIKDGSSQCFTSVLYVEDEFIKEHTIISKSIEEGVDEAKKWIGDNFSEHAYPE